VNAEAGATLEVDIPYKLALHTLNHCSCQNCTLQEWVSEGGREGKGSKGEGEGREGRER